MHQNLVPDPFLILLNNPPQQTLHARIYFENKTFLKDDYQKALKKPTFFLSNLVPFNGQSY